MAGEEQMKIRFIRSWREYIPGTEIDAPDGMANIWIARGIVEEIKSQAEIKTNQKHKHHK